VSIWSGSFCRSNTHQAKPKHFGNSAAGAVDVAEWLFCRMMPCFRQRAEQSDKNVQPTRSEFRVSRKQTDGHRPPKHGTDSR
jgi:hypothetical protein